MSLGVCMCVCDLHFLECKTTEGRDSVHLSLNPQRVMWCQVYNDIAHGMLNEWMILQHHFTLLSNLFSSVKGRYNPSPATFPGWLAKLNESAFCNSLMILLRLAIATLLYSKISLYHSGAIAFSFFLWGWHFLKKMMCILHFHLL